MMEKGLAMENVSPWGVFWTGKDQEIGRNINLLWGEYIYLIKEKKLDLKIKKKIDFLKKPDNT